VKSSKEKVRVYAALFSVVIIWGLCFLAIKDVVQVVPVFTFLFLQAAGAVIALGILGGAQGALRFPRCGLLALTGMSLLSPIGDLTFEAFGTARTQPSHVSVIIAVIPTAVYLVALLRRQERLTWKKGLGVTLTYIGIILIVSLSGSTSGASLMGDLLIIGVVFCIVVRSIFIKEMLKRVTPLQLTFYQFLLSLFFFGPLAATDNLLWVAQLTPTIILEILYLGFLSAGVAHLAINYAISHLSVTQVAVATSSIPLITLFAEILLMGTSLTFFKAIGIVATITGVTLTQLPDNRE